MKVMVHGRNVDVTDYMKEYVTKKVGKLERYLPQIGEVRAELTQNMTRSANDRYTAQVTIWANGQILRAEEATSDIFASIDATVDKIRPKSDVSRDAGTTIGGALRMSPPRKSSWQQPLWRRAWLSRTRNSVTSFAARNSSSAHGRGRGPGADGIARARFLCLLQCG